MHMGKKNVYHNIWKKKIYELVKKELNEKKEGKL